MRSQWSYLLASSCKLVTALHAPALAHHVVKPDAVEDPANQESKYINGELAQHVVGESATPQALAGIQRTSPTIMFCIRSTLMLAACREHVTVPPPSNMIVNAATVYLYRPMVTRLLIFSAFVYASYTRFHKMMNRSVSVSHSTCGMRCRNRTARSLYTPKNVSESTM